MINQWMVYFKLTSFLNNSKVWISLIIINKNNYLLNDGILIASISVSTLNSQTSQSVNN